MNFNNYNTIFEKDVKDLDSTAFLLRHEKTGARVFILSNNDDNKVFYIGFRTTPSDDTGVAHIMEHSVLCGSEKYPLKDPFVELIKGSMNTFLNAMTFPDKTVYPVASTNEKDFRNLMSVYMDAVFRPNIYVHPEIMKQEGWNYSITDPDGPVEYNGVVFNEMKGAFSSPESVLERETLHALFPDTTYGFESGGDPQYIPDLTYENFLDFHRKYYHPSNSFIYLYGDMDIAERLDWMDREYLSRYDAQKIDSEVKDQIHFSKMARISKTYAVSEDEPLKENTYLSYNINCGTNLDPCKYYALQMIQYALVDTQGAPVRQRLLDEGIGKDILSGFETGLKQEYFSIISKNAEESQAQLFLDIIKDEFEKAAGGSLNHRSLTASLNTLEFRYKEADFGGYPKGLVYGLNALDSWLYDDGQPLMHIECSDTFRFLRDNIDTGYFEDLIRTWLINNPDSALIILSPQKGLAAQKEQETAEKLRKFKESLSPEQIDALIADTKALAAYQEEEDTEEKKKTIPLLERSDLKRVPPQYSNIEDEVDGIRFIHHDYFTNGICYIDIFFNADQVPPEKLVYLSLLKSAVSYVDTDNYSFSQLNDEINIETGGLSMDMGLYSERFSDDKYSILADLSFRALDVNLDRAFELAQEVLFRSHYDDDKRLYEIIAELKSKLQMSLTGSGHVAAALRSRSYFSEIESVRELVNGISFYKFVEHLEKNFDSEKESLKNGIRDVLNTILRPENLIVSFTGDRQEADLVRKKIKTLNKTISQFCGSEASAAPEKEKTALPVKDRRYKLYDFKPGKKSEAFRTSSSVQYAAKSGKYCEGNDEYTGAVQVLMTIMRFEYLWFNIRVQGGAYGCMGNASPAGCCSFVSYRDPNLKRTYDVFDQIPDFLESFEADEREMTKYVIGTMSNVDMPLTPSMKGVRDMNAYLSGVRYEDIRKAREEIIDCSAAQIRALAPMMRRALEMNCICTVGSETKISEDSDLFDDIKNLFD